MEFEFKFEADKLLKATENLPLIINRAFRQMAEDTAKNAQDKIDGGSVGLRRRTGNLSGSIKVLRYVQPSAGGVGSALVGSNSIYAGIHEYGGVIRPKNGQYLTFQIEGRWVRVKQVTIPARPYLQPATTETIGKIEDYLSKSLEDLTGMV